MLWCQRPVVYFSVYRWYFFQADCARLVEIPKYTFTADDVGRIFTWSEVGAKHRVRHGIYQRKGELISLLTDFGRINPCYPDFHGESNNVIHYTGNGRRGDQKLDPE